MPKRILPHWAVRSRRWGWNSTQQGPCLLGARAGPPSRAPRGVGGWREQGLPPSQGPLFYTHRTSLMCVPWKHQALQNLQNDVAGEFLERSVLYPR